MFFLIGFWMHFGRDLGAKMGEKSMQKRCQKHVGIDLEVQVAKTQKLRPLTAFLVFLQVFGSIFCRFLRKVGAKMEEKSDKNR